MLCEILKLAALVQKEALKFFEALLQLIAEYAAQDGVEERTLAYLENTKVYMRTNAELAGFVPS